MSEDIYNFFSNVDILDDKSLSKIKTSNDLVQICFQVIENKIYNINTNSNLKSNIQKAKSEINFDKNINMVFPDIIKIYLPNSQKEKLSEITKPIYFRFVAKVAQSRKKTFEETRSVAKGRVWTGEMALEKGLVDVLGGLNEAITIASKRIGVANPTIKRF
ncbi:MAG: S49 family peptidase, partial [Candidatus Sericytochromatia bacterium]